MHRIAFLLIVTAILSSCSSKAPALTSQEKAALLGPNSSTTMPWHKVAGPDFTVYHGVPKSSAEGEIGFYIGGHPSFTPKPGSTRHAGHLGTHKVTWHRKTKPDGTIYQATLFALGNDGYKIHAWVSAHSPAELETLTRELGTLRIFSKNWQP
ncbi:MAG: hypothetical protein JWR15_1899 [Prosthecobacter sp.]|nr:hypothetical protein [Prosthecobacter sp.]